MNANTTHAQVEISTDGLALESFIRSLGDTELLLIGGGDISLSGN